MANLIQHKRSSVASKIPLTTDLDLGEISINDFDGKMFIKKDDGAEAIVEIGAGGGGGGTTVLTDVTLGSSIAFIEFLDQTEWLNYPTIKFMIYGFQPSANGTMSMRLQKEGAGGVDTGTIYSGIVVRHNTTITSGLDVDKAIITATINSTTSYQNSIEFDLVGHDRTGASDYPKFFGRFDYFTASYSDFSQTHTGSAGQKITGMRITMDSATSVSSARVVILGMGG